MFEELKKIADGADLADAQKNIIRWAAWRIESLKFQVDHAQEKADMFARQNDELRRFIKDRIQWQ